MIPHEIYLLGLCKNNVLLYEMKQYEDDGENENNKINLLSLKMKKTIANKRWKWTLL